MRCLRVLECAGCVFSVLQRGDGWFGDAQGEGEPMKVQELMLACVDSMNHPERSLPEKPLVVLTGSKTLFPKGVGPRPLRLLNENPYTRQRTWHYDAMSVLAALAAAGLVEVQFPVAAQRAEEATK